MKRETHIKHEKSISKLATIDELYLEKKQILIHTESGDFYTLILKGRELDNAPDCKISCYKNNLWFRTPKGLNKEKYNTTGSLQLAVKIVLESRVKDYIIGYSLNNTIDIF